MMFNHSPFVRSLLAGSMLLMAGFLSGCDKLKELPIGKGFTAKYLCSYRYNSGLDEDLIVERFIKPKVQPLPLVWEIKTDDEQQIVTVGDKIFLGENSQARAIHTETTGCTLLVDRSIEEVLAHRVQPLEEPILDANQPWPHGRAGVSDPLPDGLDSQLLQDALDEAFREPATGPRNTTSLLVAYRGQLIAERYALGVTAETPVLGWSMTKSITATLIGLLVDRGLINLDDPAPFSEWARTDKQSIRIRHILQMASGLDFLEGYGGYSDVTKMLYTQADQVAYVLARPLIHPPGTVFNYNTGDANLLARIVQDQAGGTAQAIYDFYQQELFFPIGITSAFIELDASGQFVGGAYGFMTPRDWLRLGQLYLQKGQWAGRSVLSEQWIDFATSPSPAASHYGAQIWLNTNGNKWADVPHDAFYFAGHQGQRVVIIPSRHLVIVRTGVTEAAVSDQQNRVGLDTVIPMIIRALPESDNSP